MQNIHRVTYALLVLVLGTAVFAITRGRGQNAATAANKQASTQGAERDNAVKKWYPTADYDEAEPSDPGKRAARKEAQKRHNKSPVGVMRTPHPEDAEVVAYSEGTLDFPALPVGKSDLIVEADVLAAEAHLSENKRSVFSEFTIRVNKVFKTATATSPRQGDVITIERVGGVVRYPNGRTLLYRNAGVGMPRVSGRYVFFLSAFKDSENYMILTGYEFGEKGIVPLDQSQQFEAFTGYAAPAFITAIDDLLAKASSR